MPSRSRREPSLWQQAGRAAAAEHAPLAERLRPRRLDELVGLSELLAPGAPLRREVEARRLASLLLWGPPGSGKTTLARVLAAEAGHGFTALSAVSAGVEDVRAALAAADEAAASGTRTLLFVDEIHRFHRGQQDALLHAVEEGRVTLVGATTENPAFHVNAALLSRCRLLRLPALGRDELHALAQRALADTERGLGAAHLALQPEAADALVAQSGGDARRLLNQLELAARLAQGAGRGTIEADDARAARGEAVPAHDRDGDAHYDLLSALHKSLRGSDPDAAAYWVQRLLVAGEDPRVVARRLVRMASEDVGLADPRALGVAVDALAAVEFLGLPEGDAALVQAAIYLALAPRSDAVYRAAGAARAAVEEFGALPVPDDLRNAPTSLARALGHGAGYVNPHAAPEGVTAQEHLPRRLAGARFYEPGARGAEPELLRRLREIRRRRAVARGEEPEPDPRAPGGSAAGPAGTRG
jgi:putative ATPase